MHPVFSNKAKFSILAIFIQHCIRRSNIVRKKLKIGIEEINLYLQLPSLFTQIIKKNFKHSSHVLNEEGTEISWIKEKDMKNHELKYSISDRGMWYSIIFKEGIPTQ